MIDTLAAALLARFDELFGKPPQGGSVQWNPSRLEHSFFLRSTGPDQETRLIADQFPGGSLDWYSFDVELSRAAEDAGPQALVTTVRSFVPTPVRLVGMPNVRWWEFEENRVGLGLTTASKTDLVKMLLAEFSLVFSNDWFLVPFTIDTGSLVETRGIVVSDNFGFNTLIEPVAKRHRELHLAGNWSMWTLGLRRQPGQIDARFFLAPAIDHVIDSKPLDEVLYLRDEMANLVWAVETLIPDPMGGGRDARHAANLLSGAVLAAFPVELPEEVADLPIRYRLMGSVPESWIPLAPVRLEGEATARALLQGAMPRIPAIDPARDDAGQPILKNNVVLPRGAILARDPVNNPNVIFEEEVLRDGILVRRRLRHTRWVNGRPYTWAAFEKRSGRGEGSSGLAFDQVVPKPPKESP